MGTTTHGPPGIELTSFPLDPLAAPLGQGPDQPAEVLIRAARRRQRRRWMLCAIAFVLAIGLTVGLLDGMGGSPPARARHGPAAASPGEVAAFVSRAEKGFTRQFRVRYAVQYGSGRHAFSGSVVAAQVSTSRFAYTATPAVTDIHAADSGSSVLVSPTGEMGRKVLCERQSATSPWRCSIFSSAGMGTDAELLGPYPPMALVLGLQNAVVEYSGANTGQRVAPQPAHFVLREMDARTLSCLDFGDPVSPVASVCLDAANVIASYDIPTAVSSIAYTTVELRSWSRHVPDSALTLPASPATAAPVPGTPPWAEAKSAPASDPRSSQSAARRVRST